MALWPILPREPPNLVRLVNALDPGAQEWLDDAELLDGLPLRRRAAAEHLAVLADDAPDGDQCPVKLLEGQGTGVDAGVAGHRHAMGSRLFGVGADRFSLLEPLEVRVDHVEREVLTVGAGVLGEGLVG